MGKKYISPDERANRALKDKPIYMPDEPAIVGSPDNLKKTDEEIGHKENRGDKNLGKKAAENANETRLKAQQIIQRTPIV